MKKILLVLLLGVFMLNNVVLALGIPAGTPLIVTADKEIDADDVKLNQTVFFTTLEPVKVNGKTELKSGARVTGQVVKIKNNALIGLPGEIQVSNLKLNTPQGDYININGSVSDKGNGRYWANVGWFFLFPLLFIKGDDGKIQAGMPTTLRTLEDYSVNL